MEGALKRCYLRRSWAKIRRRLWGLIVRGMRSEGGRESLTSMLMLELFVLIKREAGLVSHAMDTQVECSYFSTRRWLM